MQASVQDVQARNESLAVTLISAGHFLSHFYALTLPAMFLTLKETFNVSYLELGLAVTAYNLLKPGAGSRRHGPPGPRRASPRTRHA